MQNEQIDFNKFSKGVYLIKLNLGGVISTKKLIKI
ncbi:MAG: T9SS type A sorting domain-containing protein [Bacteroidota bacterium]